MIIANEQLREKFVAHFDAAAIYYLNILSYKACEIAYTKCDQWLEELLGENWLEDLVTGSYEIPAQRADFLKTYIPEAAQ